MTDGDRLTEISPTLVNAIRRCGLAVYLGRSRRGEPGGSPSSPQARLGAAVHRVLAWVGDSGATAFSPTELEAEVRRHWRAEVRVEEQAALRSRVEGYFGAPEGWPGFATAEERLVIEAGRLAAEVTADPTIERWSERSLSLAVPPLRGSPDLVERGATGARIIEFKSGHVDAEDVLESGRFGQQVLMYAALVQGLGLRVLGGEVRPIGRVPFRVRVTDEAIDRACEAVVTILSLFNAAVDARDATPLARPSDRSCGYCPHVLQCPVLWTEEGTRGLEQLQIVEGTVYRVQRAHVGSVAVELRDATGTRLGRVTATGLDPRRLAALEGLALGDRVRLSGLHSGPSTVSALVARPGSWVQVARVTKS
jgi:RecB family exonuclease